LQKPINEAGAVGKKQVFGSEARLTGKGCQAFALCGGVFVFVFLNQPLNYHRICVMSANGCGY